jgi:glycosyltransferase involved in cell wall biosynthesis
MQLIYVGEGLLRTEIVQRCQTSGVKNVHLLGFFNQTQMPIAYVLGEVLCLISDSGETWGLVVNEALACNRPVIVTETVGCAPDLVTSENGWIIHLDDHHQLVQTLQQVYEQRAEWDKMGMRGQEKVTRHTFSIMSDGIMEALDSINRSS